MITHQNTVGEEANKMMARPGMGVHTLNAATLKIERPFFNPIKAEKALFILRNMMNQRNVPHSNNNRKEDGQTELTKYKQIDREMMNEIARNYKKG